MDVTQACSIEIARDVERRWQLRLREAKAHAAQNDTSASKKSIDSGKRLTALPAVPSLHAGRAQ
jgi:hypothetical protein